MSKIGRWLLALMLMGVVPVSAATRTVGSGKTHATIQACATVAVAGDTCEVYAGTYTEANITPANSGSAGSPITFIAAAGQAVTVVGRFVVTDKAYITIDGFIFTGGANAVRGVDDDLAGHEVTTNHIIVRNNIVANGTYTTPFYLYGDYMLLEYNNAYGTDTSSPFDFLEFGGDYWVIRGNRFHDVEGNGDGGSPPYEHIDFTQGIGGVAPVPRYVLIEGNVMSGCNDTSAQANCHLGIFRTLSSGISTNLILRFNYAVNLDGSGISFGGSGDDVRLAYAYQNTFATGYALAENGAMVSWQTVTGGAAKNNIAYNTGAGEYSPTVTQAVTGISYNGNIAYVTGYSGIWNSPYSTEATYTTLRNQNPVFANAPTDGTLSSGSPAIASGVALTTVAASDSGSGTSLVLAEAGYFQSGWAGTGADWVRIGASTTAEIASIDYATNTVTLASGVSRSDGDSVYLYKRSDGQIVLNSGAPDIGAYPYGFTPAEPTALSLSSTATTITLSWTHGGTNVTRFETQVDSALPRNVGLPIPSGTTYSATLPALANGVRTVLVRACSGTLCTASSTLTIVKMEPTPWP